MLFHTNLVGAVVYHADTFVGAVVYHADRMWSRRCGSVELNVYRHAGPCKTVFWMTLSHVNFVLKLTAESTQAAE